MAQFRHVVLVIWLTVYALGYGTCVLDLPHPKCSYTGGVLQCDGADIDIPHSFSVGLVPSNVTQIVLSCPSYSQQEQCNMMRGDLYPLPYRNKLEKIYLYGFRTDSLQPVPANRARIPVPQFLDNVKRQITHLEIWYSKIGYLDGEFLRGFQALHYLNLPYNDISTVEVESFQLLMDPLIPAPSVQLYLRIPNLFQVSLHGNHLQDLDWAVFRPVARRLQIIQISGQQPGLNSLRRSGQPFSMIISQLHLQINNIREIPAEVLDTVSIYGSGHLFVQDNKMCSALPTGDCSCCEMVNLMKWIQRNTKTSTGASTAVSFSCGTGSSLLTHGSTFPLAMFKKCPETDKTTTYPYRSCYAPHPLRVECSLGRFEMHGSVRMTSDAATIVFASDGRRQCDNILYDLHSKILGMAGISGISTTRATDHDAVQATCQNGTVRVDEEDPDASAADQILFQSDSSLACHERLNEFADFVYTLPQNSLGNGHSSPILSIDAWLSDFLICTDTEPLVVNCIAGVLASSEKNLTHSPAITLFLHTDGSLGCHVVLGMVHEHILKQEMVQTGSYTYAESEDAIVAVIQHGVTVISESHPSKSTKRNLKYYSAPNRLSRNKFRSLMDLLNSPLGTGAA